MDSNKHNKGRVIGLLCIGIFILGLFGLLALSTNDDQHTSRHLLCGLCPECREEEKLQKERQAQKALMIQFGWSTGDTSTEKFEKFMRHHGRDCIKGYQNGENTLEQVKEWTRQVKEWLTERRFIGFVQGMQAQNGRYIEGAECIGIRQHQQMVEYLENLLKEDEIMCLN